MIANNQATIVMAETVMEIIHFYFGSPKERNDHSCFRVKTLYKNEVICFLDMWSLKSKELELDDIVVVIAADSDDDYPEEFKADSDKSITWYRNNNSKGLIYIETKTESDEQGLQNIFTLQDRSFLNVSFTADGLDIPRIISQKAWAYIDNNRHTPFPQSLLNGMLNVLKHIHSDKNQLPVRSFINFVLAVCESYRDLDTTFTNDESLHLIGQKLVCLNLFPDPNWFDNDKPAQVQRRFELNNLHSDLVTSSNVDVELEEVIEICDSIVFRDESGDEYDSEGNTKWKSLCIEYSKNRSDEARAQIPYRIFEQLFRKDVKGLKLGDRVQKEIEDSAIDRLDEFNRLDIMDGLNARKQEDASVFLNAGDDGVEPFSDVITVKTRKMLERVANPVPTKVDNPLIQLAETVRGWVDNYGSNNKYKVLMRSKDKVESSPALGLFSFIYGPSLLSIAAFTSDELEEVVFDFEPDKALTTISPLPQLEDDEENEGEIWKPVALEILLISSEGDEIESSGKLEWLPEDYEYLSLLWFSISSTEAYSDNYYLKLSDGESRDDWVSSIANGMLSYGASKKELVYPESGHINSVVELINDSKKRMAINGLTLEIINEYIDNWTAKLNQSKLSFVPNGDTDSRLQFLLAIDTLSYSGGLLMFPSHPIRLRWISHYLQESVGLAMDALNGELKLNEQNDRLYLKWISDLSPQQQPPVTSAIDRKLLFATGEIGWCEVFSALDQDVDKQDGAVIESASIIEMVSQIKTYLDAHPYKVDGLKLLILLQQGAKLPAELIKEVRKGTYKNANINIHVLAPTSLWGEVTSNFEELPMENRVNEGNKLFPPLQLHLHSFDPEMTLQEMVGQHTFDISLVSNILLNQVTKQDRTESDIHKGGTFDPLLDAPIYTYGGLQGGEISVSMLPRSPDAILSDWATLAVRHHRNSSVSSELPENTDYVELRIDFEKTARIYEDLHDISHWVLLLERYITREQVENLNNKPDILTVKSGIGVNGAFTLIVSSDSGKQFITTRLENKLSKIIGENKGFKNRDLALKIYDETRKIAPRLVLQAMGISRATEEILGLMIAMNVAEHLIPVSCTNGIEIWLSLDDNPEWFQSSNTYRADLCRITLEEVDDFLNVDILIVEGKFRQAYDPHGITQVKASLSLFDDIMNPLESGDEYKDARLWREKILTAIENVNPDASNAYGDVIAEVEGDNKYRLPEKIRSDFRDGRFKLRSSQGVFSICCYTEDHQLETSLVDSDKTIHLIKSFKNQILELISDDGEDKLIGIVSLPKTNDIPIQDEIIPEQEVEVSEVINHRGGLGRDILNGRYQLILDKFSEFGIDVEQPADIEQRYIEGPASILYRILPGQGVAPKRLFEKADVLKLALALEQEQNIRFGNHRGFVTIDVPKSQEDRYFVQANEMWESWKRPLQELAAPLGEDSYSNIVELNFSSANSPHLLIGGTTGSGKSEALNTILDGLLKFYDKSELKLLLVDPKGTELQQYETSEYLEGAIGWDDEDAILLLETAVAEMQARYLKLKGKKTRSLVEYNEKVGVEDKIPWWVIVLDEYADLTSDRESKKAIEDNLKRLAQKARAAGIHVIIATQKPSADVISTNLRSNLPAQLALRVRSGIESRVIMDESGAETLNGKGDALLKSEGKTIRLQCAKV